MLKFSFEFFILGLKHSTIIGHCTLDSSTGILRVESESITKGSIITLRELCFLLFDGIKNTNIEEPLNEIIGVLKAKDEEKGLKHEINKTKELDYVYRTFYESDDKMKYEVEISVFSLDSNHAIKWNNENYAEFDILKLYSIYFESDGYKDCKKKKVAVSKILI